MTLNVCRLCLYTHQKVLIDQLDWIINPGECWLVYGQNGVGKTTLLKTIAGLRQPDDGDLILNGRILDEWKPQELARQRAYLSQTQQDAFGFSVFETVLAARFPYYSGQIWESNEDKKLAVDALEQMSVSCLVNRDIRTLSGGERQRVAIAALLAQNTPLLLLDEPAAALDLSHQAALLGLMSSLCKEQGKAVIMVVHDLNLAHNVATHVLLLYGNGEWEAGTRDNMMCPEKLSRCLNYPVEKVMYGSRPVFVPV